MFWTPSLYPYIGDFKVFFGPFSHCGSKKFGGQSFGVKIFGPQKIWGIKIFGGQNFWGSKLFEVKFFGGSKFFGGQNFLLIFSSNL